MTNIANLINKAKQTGKDETKASAGGFDILPEGTAKARLVGYYELGKHDGEWEGQPKVTNEVELVFELQGGKYAPVDVDGKQVPRMIRVQMAKSGGKNSGWLAMCLRCLSQGQTLFVELLGEDFFLDITHSKKGEKTYANVNKKTIRRAKMETMDAEGNVVLTSVPVDKPITPLGIFMWDHADAEQWDGIYVPGEYEERKDDKGNVTAPAKSKNLRQLKIASAKNFDSLPCYAYAKAKLFGGDAEGVKAGEDALAAATQVETPKREAPPQGDEFSDDIPY